MTAAPYDPRVEMFIARAQQNVQRHQVEGAELDVRDIPWPEVPLYGFDHANQTMLLADRIGHDLGITRRIDQDAVKLAGLLHDLGRRWPWQRLEGDPRHNERSVEIACGFLRLRGTPTSLIDEVGWLIANHDLSRPNLPTDPRLQALWDADSLEAARLSPGTGDGLKIWRQRTTRLCSQFAKDKAVQREWLRYRGWRQ